ncbi:hypothetical protein E2562_024582 [Oryza meyeriana var. granulata]|uniref:Uncharacterized protein n=1 Tax=Oryza meyeriana var. granulata TaxID=110450 RepID=A0A6G1CSE7_9ORYZ|nr:hypothetical protein E2562_024582 [Oryza meyeriana var. granulata]
MLAATSALDLGGWRQRQFMVVGKSDGEEPPTPRAVIDLLLSRAALVVATVFGAARGRVRGGWAAPVR